LGFRPKRIIFEKIKSIKITNVRNIKKDKRRYIINLKKKTIIVRIITKEINIK
jgi:hypothetical protein